MKTLYQPTEHQIQNMIIQYLQTLGAKVLRINSGMMAVGEGKYRRMIRLAPTGTPDLIACYKGKFICCEVKRPKNKPTIWQKQALEEWREAGAIAFVATSIEDVEKELNSL